LLDRISFEFSFQFPVSSFQLKDSKIGDSKDWGFED